MELWIRSQDRESIIKVEKLELISDFLCGDEPQLIHIDSDKGRVGSYSTEERALEVLDEIESVMKTNCGFELYSRTGVYPDEFNKKWNCVPVYQMPES